MPQGQVAADLRSVAGESFDTWYSPIQQEMDQDEMLRFFKLLRNEFEKVGTPVAGARYQFPSGGELPTDAGPPPQGATEFFLDSLGPGWIVNVSGQPVKYYVEFPAERVSVDLLLSDPPTIHLGEGIADRSAANLARLYLRYLDNLVERARDRFAT